jgi:hypothetical protein
VRVSMLPERPSLPRELRSTPIVENYRLEYVEIHMCFRVLNSYEYAIQTVRVNM